MDALVNSGFKCLFLFREIPVNYYYLQLNVIAIFYIRIASIKQKLIYGINPDVSGEGK